MSTQTSKRIQAAFIRMALEKPVDKITVRELVEECGLNRNSFYYYFEDIPDLIISILEEAVFQAAALHTREGFEKLARAIAQALEQNAAFCRNVYYSKNREILGLRLNEVVNLVIGRYLEQNYFSTCSISQQDREILLQICRMEVMGMIREWMQGGMNYNLEDRVSRITQLQKGALELMIRQAQSRA